MLTRLSLNEIKTRLKQRQGWRRTGKEISREYKFSAFIPAMAFVNHVADIAETMDHHPEILIQYNRVTLRVSTHSAGGLTDLDFALAHKIDA